MVYADVANRKGTDGGKKGILNQQLHLKLFDQNLVALQKERL